MAVYQFAEFELHEELRQLRLRGREVVLQPRAFDVLAYLVSHQGRVVAKDELLENLWAGVVVTDGSLQRAVSLARAALRSGGLDQAIRTYSKRGYRFMPEPTRQAGPATAGAQSGVEVQTARDLLNAGAWAEAAQAFESADALSSLSPEDLENWGVALQCAGTGPAAIEPFERAARAYCDANQCEAAARAAISLARIRFETQEWAVAKGCLRRAESMLDGLPLCEQHGHLSWVRSWMASYAGDVPATIEHACRTVEIARRLDNLDLEAMGLLFWGIALQANGETQRGLELQDEAGAVVLTGNVTPLLGGLVYCGLLGGCCNTGDWPRASQWSESFTRWCRRNGVERFSGSCLLHRVEVFIARGELEQAEAEIQGSEETIAMSKPSVMADAHRFLGDVQLLRGELDRAETSYRAAYERGANTHPGYALLLHRRGQSEAAIRALRRSSTGGFDWSTMEKRPLYLATAVMIAAESGDHDTAGEIMTELDQQPDSWSVGTLRGHVLRARGEMALYQGEIREAARLLRDAVYVYQELDASLEAAAARLRLAEALLEADEAEGAVLELVSAETVFKRNGARLYLEDCRKLREILDRVRLSA
ncbi:MAG: winged helix-turn-helix domain-containing protein [Arenicellales bacterium]